MTEHELEVRRFVEARPTPAWPWRLPIIRHVRAIMAWHRIDKHYETWALLGMLPANRDLDEAVAEAIWRGEK